MPKPYKNAAGIWSGEINLGIRDGKRIRRWVYGPDYATVAAKLRLGLAAANPERAPSPQLGDFLASWLRTARDVNPHTLAGYRSIVDAMPPSLLVVPLRELGVGHVQAWVDSLDGSPRTVAWKRNTLRAALNDARRLGLCERNSAALARVPRQRRPRRIELAPADVAAILAALAGWRYEPAAAVAIGCGLRQGELLGLAWPDVGMSDTFQHSVGKITVRAALARRGGEYVRVPAKTAASEATVPLPAFAAAALARWDARQAAEWHEAHEGRPVDVEEARKAGLVFTTEDGRPVSGSVLTHQFQRCLRAAGLPVVSWHALRHATADLLAEGGAPQTVTRDFMRHASYATTADHYVGSSREALERAAELIDRAIGGG